MRLNQLFELINESAADSCWTGYRRAGTKIKGGRTVPNCVPKESVAEDSEKYYAIVNKINNKILSTHQDLESAKDEWRGLDSGQRALFRVVTTKKKPQDWSLDEANKDDSSEELNPLTKFALRKIRAKHPQAKSEFDALIADLNSGQQQDRRDISRLDLENDQEEADIERLDVENDKDESRLDRIEQELAAIRRLIK